MSDSSSWCAALRRLALYIRGGFICVYCERNLAGCKPHEITLDHVVASGNGHRGANHGNDNLVVACNRCNAGKRERTLAQFATPEARRRVRNQLRRKVNLTLARSLMSERASAKAPASPASDAA